MNTILLPDPSLDDRFMSLPGNIRQIDAFWIPDTKESMQLALLDPDYAGQQAAFLTLSDKEPVARCVARYRPGQETGTIGFFECINDADACRTTLDTACQWLANHGIKRVIGPMDGDTWHAYRFCTGSFETAPFLKEPWNPPWYPSLWADCGFKVLDRYCSARISDPAAAATRFEPFIQRAQRQGYTFRPFRKENMAKELGILYELSLQIFSDNPHYTPISQSSFRNLYRNAGPLIHPSLCQFCCDKHGREIGYAFAFPDYGPAVRSMRGSSSPMAKWRFLRNRRKTTRVCLKTLGCIPSIRGTGLAPALAGLTYKATVALGYSETLMCLMHADNDSRRLDGGYATPLREYVLYSRDLPPPPQPA